MKKNIYIYIFSIDYLRIVSFFVDIHYRNFHFASTILIKESECANKNAK